MNHATVRLDGMEIPLIGVPLASTQEKCDRCGNEYHIQDVRLTFQGTYICLKCGTVADRTISA